MRLDEHVVSFDAHGIPMLGNMRSGALMGLTPEGAELCRKMSAGDISADEVPSGCATLVEHLMRGGYLAQDGDEGDRRAPSVSSAYVHVTQRCNLSCAFCYSLDETRNAGDDPTFEQLAHAFRLLAELGARRLVLSGGEPFLREDLPQLAAEAKRQGISSIVVATNGLRCTRDRVEALAGQVDRIAVAFDGCAPDSTPYLRGEQRFAQLVEAIKTIKACGIPTQILPTIHGRNLEDIPHYRELAASLDTDVSYSLLTAPTASLGDLALTSEQLRRLGELSARERIEMGDDAVAGDGMRLSARCSCGVGARTLSVGADGSLYPCHMLHRPELSVGDGFVDEADEVRAAMMAHACASLVVTQIDACRECAFRYLCGGGCRARAYLDTGSLAGADSYCELYRQYYDTCLAALAARARG